MSRTAVGALALALAILVSPTSLAWACDECDTHVGGTNLGENKAAIVIVVDPRGGPPAQAPLPAAKAGNARRWDCRYYDEKVNSGGGQIGDSFLPFPGDPATQLVAGTTYIFMCNDENGQPVRLDPQFGFKLVKWEDGKSLTSPLEDAVPEVALQQAVYEKRIEAPAVTIRISPEATQLIGVPTWFWADQPRTEIPDEVEGGGLVARIAAVANADDGLEIDPKDGTGQFTCRVRSTAWGPGVSETDADACRHTYQHVPRGGSLVAEARVRYDVRWWVDGRPDLGGDLNPIWSPWQPVPLTIKSAQAVTTG